MTRKFWEELIDTKVCGGYLLRELIGSTEESAVYLTRQDEETAVLKLTRTDEAAPIVPPLEHRHILKLYANDFCEVSGAPFHFFVMEAADQSLAPVIASRALSADEMRELLEPLLDALGYLHENGLAHSKIKPSNILAKGDLVKITPDSVRLAGAVALPEEDMRALGLTIIEAMTQERSASAIANVPQPFRDIVEHALQLEPGARWTARQAAMRLAGPLPVAAPGMRATVAAAELEVSEPPAYPRVPIWLYPAAGVVMLLAVIYALFRSTPDSSMAASAPPPIVTPAPVVTAPPVARPAPPPKPTPFETAPRAAVPTPAAAPAGANGWFVVVASYGKEADAAQEAQVLNRHHAQFKPRVFPPSAIDTHYLVIIGSGLSQEAAEATRQRAVASGLPADTYIKKYPAGKK